ncbi:FAD binding domain-containing protein [Chloroflexota bacterium]
MLEEYLFPRSVQEALRILKSYKGQAQIIAGGTDLILELKDKVRNVKCLVDIGEIEVLKKIEYDRDYIKVGAGVTHSQVASSELIQRHATVLAEAAFAVGSPLVRNLGTIAGNIVNAQPAADTAVALFALEAEVEITNSHGTTIVPVENLYKDVGISKIDSTAEIVTSIRFKALKSNQGSIFVRLSQRKALALPVLNAAVVVTVKNYHFEEVKIVIAPVAPCPFRPKSAENLLRDVPIERRLIEQAAEAAASEANPRDSALRGSSEYRKEMVKVLVKRALKQATQRAGGNQ